MKIVIQKILKYYGYEIIRSSCKSGSLFPDDMEKEFIDIYLKCKPYTMTDIERMYNLYCAVKHVNKHNVPGAIVECGVWRGGSMMLCAYTLEKIGDKSRKLFLYDTFLGMPMPTEKDNRIFDNQNAKRKWEVRQGGGHNIWDYSPLEEVKNNILKTKYNMHKVTFIKGKVEDTIPERIPDKIAILRLDTDWYESTKHELNYLYPKLSKNGILIIDDYGYWKGAKDAMDEYMEKHNLSLFLSRIDTGRVAVK